MIHRKAEEDYCVATAVAFITNKNNQEWIVHPERVSDVQFQTVKQKNRKVPAAGGG